MKSRLLIIIGLVIVSVITVIVFSSLFDVSHIFDNSNAYQVLDVKMNVIGIKQFYEIGEPLSFSVYVSSLGKTVPWPTLRIYQNYVDVGSEPVYSRMYMTPIESEDKQKSVEWREKIWNFPLEPDHSIKFFDKGNYTLRVDVDAKKHVLVNFKVVNSTNEFETIDDFDETYGGPGNRHPAFLGYYMPDICTGDMVKFLKKNSNMFDNDIPYSHLDGPTDIGINPDDLVQCENELLENRDEEPSWKGK